MYTLYMITNVAVLTAIRTAPCGFTSVAAYLAEHGVTKCRPSRRNYKRLTLNPYDVRKTPSAGSISQRRQKFEPAFLLR